MSRTLTPSRHPWIATLLLLVSWIVLLQACGGGGKKAPPVVDAVPTGYYGTNGTSNSTATVFTDTATPVNITDLQGMIYNGRLIMMSRATQNLSYDGNITVSGSSYTGSVTVYQNRVRVSTASVSGTINQGVSVTGTLTGTGAGSGTFTLIYGDATAVDNTMVTRSLDWTPVDANDNFPSIDINNPAGISAGGVANLGVFARCGISGSINAIPQTHLYVVNIVMAAQAGDPFPCNSAVLLPATYSGFASLRQTTQPNDTLVLTITNGEYSMSWEFDRQ